MSAVLVLLLVLCIANSTVTAGWVPHSEVLTNLALIAGVIMGALALTRTVPWPAALGLGLAAAPVAGYLAAYPSLSATHPGDPADPVGLVGVWANRVVTGEAGADVGFFLYLLCCLFWVVGGWLSWCVFRWRQPLLGLVPGAAAFATTVLNYPTDQNGYTLGFLLLTLSLLLWTSYNRVVDSAVRRRVKLTGDARWDFWESGVVVTATVIALGIFLPPLSNSDRTVDIENSTFRGWADLQQKLNHPVAFGHGASTGTSIGFSSDVPLAGPIQRTGGIVMTYTIDGNYGGPRYFRGVNLERTSMGPDGAAWRYSGLNGITVPVEKDSMPPYREQYQALQSGGFKIQMLKPPDKATDVLFYPGNLLKVDRAATAHSTLGVQGRAVVALPGDKVNTLDRLSGAGQQGGAGAYKVSVQYSTATEDQLRAAGTDYGVWLDPYRNFGNLYRATPDSTQAPGLSSGSFYRSPASLQRIHDLAVQITAGKDNPYDQALAIESYLRTNFTYTLTPPRPPRDVDPLEYFLFTTKQGYCEYFASAMGDMLRSLGVPTRLVNGYGPGTFDEKLNRYVVRESDAHTWVEVYYPQYGWVPFEPTPDGTYFPIPRGSTTVACGRDAAVCNSVGDNGATSGQPNSKPAKGAIDTGDPGTGGAGVGIPGLPVGVPVMIGILLILGSAAWVAVSRYLRPRTVNGVWQRTALLSRMAGIAQREGETPLEFGARLASEVPEAAGPLRQLADGFTLAAYAPRELAVSSRTAVLALWEELRPALLRRVRLRFRIA